MFARVSGWIVTRSRRFAMNESGAILPLFAMVLVLVIVIAGAGFDYARAINQRQALARGLDTAMLAVARELSIRNMSAAEIKAYLDANYEAYFGKNTEGSASFGQNIILAEPQIDTNARTISVEASADVPTTFIRLAGLGPDTINVGVSAQAIYPKSVEAALVVDVTGSMGGSRISALRTAAAAFVNTLVPPGSANTNEKVRISLVPYAAGVNIGTPRATLATHGANTSRSSFSDCVSERKGDEAYSDTSYANDPVGPGTVQSSWNRGYYRSGNRVRSSSGFVCPNSELIPLTLDPGSAAQSGSLLHTIATLPASGNTAGQTGIAWGWYTLSNNWSGLWPSASAPAPYTDERVLKYMLIMTDGSFNTYFDGPRRVNGVDYDWLAQLSTSQSTNRAIRLCDAIKATGIKIITVGFQIGSNASAQQVMSDCASTSGDYYLADNNAELVDRFSAIANQIKTTYLSQ